MTRQSVLCAAGLAAMLLVSACATTPLPTVAPITGFSREAFAWSQAPGRGRIEGRLAYGGPGGHYSCRNTGVVLMPETPWIRQRMQTLYRSTSRAALPADEVRSRTPQGSPDYGQFVRSTACDEQGRFAFTGLPDGAWYVITAARPPSGTDIAIMRRVVVRGGQTQRVDL